MQERDIKYSGSSSVLDVAFLVIYRVHCNVRVSAASSIPTATDVPAAGSTASDVKKYLLSIGEWCYPVASSFKALLNFLLCFQCCVCNFKV